jgi:hypothetical protein
MISPRTPTLAGKNFNNLVIIAENICAYLFRDCNDSEKDE